MTEALPIDLRHLQRWIGSTETVRDVVGERLVRGFRATFDLHDAPATGDPAPLGLHWCLAPPAAAGAALGPDGHPARGGFLPPVPLPRRMWAGSSLRFHDPLRVGDAVTRQSRVADVALKEGRRGSLCFVSVDHETGTDRGPAVAERQTIVYRAAGGPDAPRTTAPLRPADGTHRDTVASPTLLFRYSALTFNGHRIHYDREYARDEEGYPGLVVHGPLQATQLLQFAAEVRGSAPTGFTFRGLQPLFDGIPYRLRARESDAGLNLWMEIGDGTRTMEAQATW